MRRTAQRPTWFLGLSGQLHDASACLVCEGEVVAAASEERFTRRKAVGMLAVGGMPTRAIRYCLAEVGIEPEQVDGVGYYFKPWTEATRQTAFRLRMLRTAPRQSIFHVARSVDLLASHLHTRELLARAGFPKQRLRWLRHHRTHAAASFYPSPFEEAAVLTIDYTGEHSCTEIHVGRRTRLDLLQSIAFPHSLGMAYTVVTGYLGFAQGSDEYKVMGLASYGEPIYAPLFRRMVRITRDGAYSFDLDFFSSGLRGPYYLSEDVMRQLGSPRGQGQEIEQRHMDIAASIQLVLEEVVLELLERLHARTGLRNLCFGGGVALNCSLNGRLLRESPFEHIWIQPAAGDDGCAVGAALDMYYASGGTERRPMAHAYLGPAFSIDEIEAALATSKSRATRLDEDQLLTETARLIAEGKIVAWFQGRMEWGPRALGARSILADPTRAEMKDILNLYVKHREDFRPFAPSVIREAAITYFECEEQPDSPFMLFVHRVRPEKQELLPAITHIDGTARIQTVDRAHNPRYWKLLQEVERLRGVPAVVNTSFNVQGEPIVCTPEDAIRCYYSTGLDALVIGDYLLVKENGAIPGDTELKVSAR